MGQIPVEFELTKSTKKDHTPRPTNQPNIFASLKDKHLQDNMAEQKRIGFAEYVASKEREAFEKSLMQPVNSNGELLASTDSQTGTTALSNMVYSATVVKPTTYQDFQVTPNKMGNGLQM